MKARYLILIPLILSCATSAPAVSEDQKARQTITRELNVSPRGSLDLENVNGRITVTTWNRNKVHIVAEKRAKAPTRQEAERILEETSHRSQRIRKPRFREDRAR